MELKLSTMDHTEYQVTIKSANQKVDDYVTVCRPTWTVHRLKEHIAETHINKPNVGDQRLIYAGNLLKDSFTLKQIFFRDSLCTELTNANKTDFTIHLVCHTPRSSNNQSANSNSTNPTSPQPRTQTPQSATPNPINAEQAHQAQMVHSLMQSDQMRQQMAAFQDLSQLVAAQIVNSLANGNLTRVISATNRVEVPAQAPEINQPAAQADQGAQHDLIDWVYYSTRALILMAVLYIHASVFRLLFLFGLLAVAFFFNRRPARRNVVGDNNANNEMGAPVVNQPPGEEDGEVVQGRLPFLKLCYLVITDFLSSLVPE